MRPIRLTLLGLALMLAAGCSNTEQAMRASEYTFNRENMLVTTGWLNRNLDDPTVLIVHVSRDSHSYTTGHIPGARLLLLSEIAADRDASNELPPLKTLTAAI